MSRMVTRAVMAIGVEGGQCMSPTKVVVILNREGGSRSSKSWYDVCGGW